MQKHADDVFIVMQLSVLILEIGILIIILLFIVTLRTNVGVGLVALSLMLSILRIYSLLVLNAIAPTNMRGKFGGFVAIHNYVFVKRGCGLLLHLF